MNGVHGKLALLEPLIWNPAFTVTEKAYSAVESLFRYGCNCCKKYGIGLDRSTHCNQLVCDTCFEQLESEGNVLLKTISDKVMTATSLESDDNFPFPKRPRRNGMELDGDTLEKVGDGSGNNDNMEQT